MQSHGLHSRTYLAGQRSHQLQIGRLERVVAATFGNPQPANLGSMVAQRFRVNCSDRRAVLGSDPKRAVPIREVDRDVRQPQRLGNGLHDGGQDLVGQHDSLHPRSKPGQHTGRIVPFAVHQSVHGAPCQVS